MNERCRHARLASNCGDAQPLGLCPGATTLDARKRQPQLALTDLGRERAANYLDSNGYIVNNAGLRLMGYRADEVIE